MAENSKIEWTTHTFNPWTGCQKISPACDHCYAESWAKRTGNADLWNGIRRRTTAAYWRQPLKWDREAAARGVRPRVFCASLADVFDNEVPDEWRADLWKLIAATPNLDWLLLTKRIGNAARMGMTALDNVWLGATIANQEEADRDIPKLIATPARVRFLSCEPLLGPIMLSQSWRDFLIGWDTESERDRHGDEVPVQVQTNRIDWVIAGAESGPRARPTHPDWLRSLRDQCAAAGTAFFFKQWGEWAPGECADYPPTRAERMASYFDGEWHYGELTPRQSEELHVDNEPDVYRLGKKNAGRMLDGRVHDEFPR